MIGILALWRAIATARGQGNVPIAVTGYNLDLIVESTAAGPPYTNYATELDSELGVVYYQNGLAGTGFSGCRPDHSPAHPGPAMIFQFQAAGANNALVLNESTSLSFAQLMFANPDRYDSI